MEIPYFKQDRIFTCGPASLQMVFAFYGKKKSESDLAIELDSDPKKGTTHNKMIEIAQKNGFYVFVNNNSNLDEVSYFLESKKPVITHFIEPSNNEGHYAVILEIKEDGKIILNDPWNGKRFLMNIKDFSKRWIDEQGEHPRWIMVVSTEEFSTGKQYLPK